MKLPIVFLDESGLLLAPLLRRSWAPKGSTPLLFQKTHSHRKVSAIAGIAASAKGRRLRLFIRLHPNQNIDSSRCIAFLTQLTRQMRCPFILLWDHLRAHRSKKMKRYLKKHPGIMPCFFPPYAPELNPIEYGWSYLKNNPLSNHAAEDTAILSRCAHRHLRQIPKRRNLLRGFIERAPLSFFD